MDRITQPPKWPGYRSIETRYHVEFLDGDDQWLVDSIHLAEAHAIHREQRTSTELPTRVVKVITAVERTVIE